MTNSTLLIQIGKDELQNILGEAIKDYFANHSPQQTDLNKLLSITEAAAFLNVAIPTIYAKVSKKEIPFHKQGKRLYFSKKELIDWIQAK